MPKSRQRVEYCSFCNSHKDAVPLLVVSNNPQARAAVCSVCALAVIEQTFRAMHHMEGMLRKLMATPNEERPIAAAIGKAITEGQKDETDI